MSDKTAVPDPPAPGEEIPVGASVPRTIVYKALKAGNTKIRLEYVRPWSGERAGVLAITVNVR